MLVFASALGLLGFVASGFVGSLIGYWWGRGDGYVAGLRDAERMHAEAMAREAGVWGRYYDQKSRH